MATTQHPPSPCGRGMGGGGFGLLSCPLPPTPSRKGRGGLRLSRSSSASCHDAARHLRRYARHRRRCIARGGCEPSRRSDRARRSHAAARSCHMATWPPTPHWSQRKPHVSRRQNWQPPSWNSCSRPQPSCRRTPRVPASSISGWTQTLSAPLLPNVLRAGEAYGNSTIGDGIARQRRIRVGQSYRSACISAIVVVPW